MCHLPEYLRRFDRNGLKALSSPNGWDEPTEGGFHVRVLVPASHELAGSKAAGRGRVGGRSAAPRLDCRTTNAVVPPLHCWGESPIFGRRGIGALSWSEVARTAFSGGTSLA